MVRWLPLETSQQWDALRQSEQTFVVFKHSTRCSISSLAKRRLEAHIPEDLSTPVYYLDLLRNRALSNQIAADSGITHESPQLLIFQNGTCILHASHLDVQPELLLNYQ